MIIFFTSFQIIVFFLLYQIMAIFFLFQIIAIFLSFFRFILNHGHHLFSSSSFFIWNDDYHFFHSIYIINLQIQNLKILCLTHFNLHLIKLSWPTYIFLYFYIFMDACKWKPFSRKHLNTFWWTTNPYPYLRSNYSLLSLLFHYYHSPITVTLTRYIFSYFFKFLLLYASFLRATNYIYLFIFIFLVP